jgi:exonuclease III
MDPANILVWNIRGLNSVARQDSVVRVLVDSTKADIVCLQETKMEMIGPRLLLSMLGSSFSNYTYLPSVGVSEGILMCWKDRIGAALATRVDAFSVSVQFASVDGTPWWMTCVYGPQSTADKLLFLQEIRGIRAHCMGPWMVAGDFNLIYRE